MVSNLTTQPIVTAQTNTTSKKKSYAPFIIGGAIVGGGAGAYITKRNLSLPETKNKIITNLAETRLKEYYNSAINLIKEFKNKQDINPLKDELSKIIDNMKNYLDDSNIVNLLEDKIKSYKRNKYVKNIGLGLVSGAIIASIPLLINLRKPVQEISPQEPVNNQIV